MQVGRVLVDRYETLAHAGEGGMGMVFRALDRATGQVVALKLLKDAEGDHLERFQQEAAVLISLDHPSIVRCLDHGRSPEGDAFLVLEWLEGETLTDLLARRRLTPAEVLELGIRLASGLAAAHAQGVIHRDIKPSNIIVAHGGITRVKLVDFGVARLRYSQRPITQTGMIIGTAGYMAPEQARGEAQIGTEADVFSLGCVLFECSTGQPAFRGQHAMAILAKLLFEAPPSVAAIQPDVPSELAQLIARMMVKRASERLRDGAAVWQALTELGEGRKLSSLARPSVISTIERRFVSVVAVAPTYQALAREPDTTLASHAADLQLLDAVQRAVVPLGARVQVLLDGTILVVLLDDEQPKEQALRAARCAIWVRSSAGHLMLALVTGWSETRGESPVGKILDRAASLLAEAPAIEYRPARGLIVVDPATRGLLEDRFELVDEGERVVLRDERPLGDLARQLLGRPTPFVGRDSELRNIRDIVESSLDERDPVIVIITGEAGMGKSRLRQELCAALREHNDVEVIASRGDLMATDSAFAMIGSLFRAALDIGAGDPVVSQREKVSFATDLFVPASERQRVSEFLGEILRVHFPDDASPRLQAARQNPQIMADQVTRAYVDFVCGFAAARPTLLVLDDLQWADAASLKLVDAALRELQTAKYVVLGFARPDLDERFPRLWANHRVHRISLAPLSRRAAGSLVRAVLGERIEAEPLDSMVERANGNALFLEELIRGHAEGRREGLPATILGMLEMRFAGLSSLARQLLRAGSVFGEGFWVAAVQGLLGDVPSDALDRCIADLVGLEVLVPRPQRRFAGQSEFAFRHALLREGVYATLTTGDRRSAHLRAGEWLERTGETDPSVLAHHLELGGEPIKAARYHARAAEQALSVSDFTAAIRAAERGLALAPVQEIAAELWAVIADASFWTREHEAAIRAAETALASSRCGSRSDCRALGDVLGAGLFHRGSASDPRRFLERLIATEPDPDASASLAFGFDAAMNYLVCVEPNEVIRRHVGRLDTIANAAAGDILVQAWRENVRASWSRAIGVIGAALSHSRAAAQHFETAGHRQYLPYSYATVAMNLTLLGDFVGADPILERARALAQTGSVQEFVAKHFASTLALWQGQVELALELSSAAFAAAEQRREHLPRLLAGLVQAEAWIGRGELDRADTMLTALGPSAAWFPYQRTWYLIALAQLRRAQARLDEAQRAVADASAQVRSLGRCHFTQVSALDVIRIDVLVARGQLEQARHAVETACERLLGRAEQIDDSNHRRSFLDHVPANARLLELATLYPSSQSG